LRGKIKANIPLMLYWLVYNIEKIIDNGKNHKETAA
jgi:hypothetical protein